MDAITELITALSLPITAALLWFIFRRHITSLKLPGGTQIDFKQTGKDMRYTPAMERLKTHLYARWENTGSIYWLGHDLMWTMQITLRGAGKNDIMFGLRQSLHHLRAVELADKMPEHRLSQMIAYVDGQLEAGFIDDLRVKLARDIDHVLDEIGAYMEANQTGFQPYAKEYVTSQQGG